MLQATATKDYPYLNQSSISELCVALSGEAARSAAPQDPACLDQLASRALTALDFHRCFLPNDSALIAALCGPPDRAPEGGWAAEYCSKASHPPPRAGPEDPCDYGAWQPESFTNSSLLDRCGGPRGLRDYLCDPASLLSQGPDEPGLDELCADWAPEPEPGTCFLQRFFQLLPAPYDFDSSQLCVDPGPLLLEALGRLGDCQLEEGPQGSWLGALGYALRVLDFMVGVSAGLEEGEGEARAGLGQAILLSSLLDNASFWGGLRPEAARSVLHTVGRFLRTEQDPALKEDLLGCFSVRAGHTHTCIHARTHVCTLWRPGPRKVSSSR